MGSKLVWYPNVNKAGAVYRSEDMSKSGEGSIYRGLGNSWLYNGMKRIRCHMNMDLFTGNLCSWILSVDSSVCQKNMRLRKFYFCRETATF